MNEFEVLTRKEFEIFSAAWDYYTGRVLRDKKKIRRGFEKMENFAWKYGLKFKDGDYDRPDLDSDL